MRSANSKDSGSRRKETADELIIESLARLDSIAMGVAIGTLLGAGIFIATNLLVLKGGEVIGPNLALLNQYFIGYEVSPVGSLVGLLYGFGSGFAIGWLGASIRNLTVTIYVNILKLKGRMSAVNDFIDNP